MKSNFDLALSQLLKHEGGYINVSSEKLMGAVEEKMQNFVRNLSNNIRGTCSVENCPNDSLAKKLCNAHYLRSRRGLDMNFPVQKQASNCVDCGKKRNHKGGWLRCANHYKMARQRVIKEALVEAMGGCCQKCKGVFSFAVYDFHHVGKKDKNPSELISTSSIEKIASELERCVLLCANCHRIEHENQF